MVTNKKVTGRAMSIPGGLAAGTAVSMAVTLGGCLVMTKLVLSELIRFDVIGYGVMIQLILSSFLGAMTAKRCIKHRTMLVCMLSGFAYFLLLMSITALFFGGQYNGVGVTGLLILGGSGTAALASAGKGTGRHKSKKWQRMQN